MHKSKSPKSNAMVLRLEKKLDGHRKLLRTQNRRVRDLEKKLVEQVNVNVELERHRMEQDRRIAELEQKIVDYDQKFVDMMVEIARVRGSCGDGGVPQSAKDGKSMVEVGCDVKCSSIESASEVVSAAEVKPGRNLAKRAGRKPRAVAHPASRSSDPDVTAVRSTGIGSDAPHDEMTAANDAGIQQKTVVASSSQDISSLAVQADCHTIAVKQRKRKIVDSCTNTAVPVRPKRNRKV